jgi:hypothetical protein
MQLLEVVDSLSYIEGLIYDLIRSYERKADGFKNDANLVISTVQELRFEIERELGI